MPNAAQIKWYANNRDVAIAKAKERNKTTRPLRRLEALLHYSDGEVRCMCKGCGVLDIDFLCIDHIHGCGAEHRKKIKRVLSEWLHAEGYPEGFQVLCFNCNHAKGTLEKCPLYGRSHAA